MALHKTLCVVHCLPSTANGSLNKCIRLPNTYRRPRPIPKSRGHMCSKKRAGTINNKLLSGNHAIGARRPGTGKKNWNNNKNQLTTLQPPTSSNIQMCLHVRGPTPMWPKTCKPFTQNPWFIAYWIAKNHDIKLRKKVKTMFRALAEWTKYQTTSPGDLNLFWTHTSMKTCRG